MNRRSPSGRNVITAKPIWITQLDKKRLASLIRNAGEPGRTEATEKLEVRLAQARVLRSREIPEDLVTMNCLVRLRDPDTLEETEYWLTFSVDSRSPGRAVPILSDLGMALLGSREGDAIEWSGPSGKRRSEIVEIVYQPERLGNYEL
jgi:regulator of nucleoside diphosphate kinase